MLLLNKFSPNNFLFIFFSSLLFELFFFVFCFDNPSLSDERLDLQHKADHHNHRPECGKRECESALHLFLVSEHLPERVSGDDERRHGRGETAREAEDRIDGGDGECDEREEDEHGCDDVKRDVLLVRRLVLEIVELFQTRDESDAARVEQQRIRRDNSQRDSDASDGDRVTAFVHCWRR